MERELPFGVPEYQTRLEKVQTGMAARDLDALLVSTPENIYYLTGYDTTGYYTYQALLVPARGAPTLVVRYLELVNAERLSWLRTAATYQDHEDPVAVTARTIQEHGQGGKRLGVEQESWFLTSRTEHRLRNLLPGIRIDDGSGFVETARVIKSPAEVAYLRRAVQIAAEGLRGALEATKAGASEAELAAAGYGASVLAGGHYPSSPMYVPSGPNSGLAHATWTDRRLVRGDTVFYEIPASYRRYSGLVMRTAVIGPPSDKIRRMADATIGGLEAAIATMKPGVTAGEVDAANRGTIARAGFGAIHHHRTGYSIGVAYPPGSGEGHIMDLKHEDPRVLQPGMVFHLVPSIFEHATLGVGFDETVLITESGREVLSDIPRQLFER